MARMAAFNAVNQSATNACRATSYNPMINAASAMINARPARADTMIVPLATIDIGLVIHLSGAINAKIIAKHVQATLNAPPASMAFS
jgi:hypothetical protein